MILEYLANHFFNETSRILVSSNTHSYVKWAENYYEKPFISDKVGDTEGPQEKLFLSTLLSKI